MGLVVLVGAPCLGAGEVVIVGGGPADNSGREAYELLKCIYIYIYIFVLSLALQYFPLLVNFIHGSFFLDTHTVISFSQIRCLNPPTQYRPDSRQVPPKMCGTV